MPATGRIMSLGRAEPLPGDYKVGEKVFYMWSNRTFADGDKVVHGQQGEVAGPATRELTGKGVELRFPGNNGDVGCPLTWVSRVGPSPWPFGISVPDIAVYHNSV